MQDKADYAERFGQAINTVGWKEKVPFSRTKGKEAGKLKRRKKKERRDLALGGLGGKKGGSHRASEGKKRTRGRGEFRK